MKTLNLVTLFIIKTTIILMSVFLPKKPTDG